MLVLYIHELVLINIKSADALVPVGTRESADMMLIFKSFFFLLLSTGISDEP